ncbi:hypothetical protein O0L34_g9498 [Tuta absoluta]|nr:hypothetical protein O0L34_g9498 [Tuta absoluta]
MYRLWTTSALVLMIVASSELVEFEEGFANELCFTCSCSSDGTSVDCSRRGLTDIPEGFSEKVKQLNLSTNEIVTFPQKIKRFRNLVLLDLSGNRLSDLPEDALRTLSALEVLDLSKNSFESWLNLNPNEVLQPASNLKILDLSHNKFNTLGNLANQELLISSSLETLILDYNKIDSIHGQSPLSGLINIRVLKVNHNPLIRIQNLMSPTLKSMYASNCELSSFPHSALAFLPSLVYLKLSYNYRLVLSSSANTLYSTSLRYLDISYCNILKPSIQGFPYLRKALLNHNMIRYLESNEFLNNTKLEYLDLSYNNIGSLKSDTFRGLTMLKHLDLSWNEIADVPEDSLLQMPSLSQIKLSRNYLTSLGNLKSTSLNVVDISSCEISSIGKESLEGLPSLVELDLSRNLLAYIPDSISSNSLKFLNLNYNRISSITNFTFFMLPRLAVLSVVGNRFTTIWRRSYFDANSYLERLDLNDNMWRCDCNDAQMYDFYEFVTLEPNKKEESYNLICNSPINLIGQTWLEACYYVWNPTEKASNADNLVWFVLAMIICLTITLVLVNVIRASMKRRLAAIQEERERQMAEARDRLRQLRIAAEQQALINTPDPRDLISPPSYTEALSMPKLNASSHSLNETSSGRSRKKRKTRKTKSSSDLLDETERNGDMLVVDIELEETSEASRRSRRRRRPRKYGSHEIAELDQSPGARRRRMSEYDPAEDNTTVEVEVEVARPLRPRVRRYSSDEDEPRESDF